MLEIKDSKELEAINGGGLGGWLTATAGQCATIALVTAEAPATGSAIYEAWH